LGILWAAKPAENHHHRAESGSVKAACGARPTPVPANYNTGSPLRSSPPKVRGDEPVRRPPMSAETPFVAPVRHPLGLPPGSVRAVLALMIAGLFWTVLALSATRPEVEVPLFLYFLTGLILLFFGSHGHTIGHQPNAGHPLGLPRGSVRALILLGSAGLFAWLYQVHHDRLAEILTPKPEQLQPWPTLLMTTGGGYAVGYVI